MITKFATLLSLCFFCAQFSHAQVEERQVDFTVSPAVISGGQIQVAYEWLKPQEFRKKQMSILDLVGINVLSPNNNQMVASKIAFVSKKSFNQLTYANMNTAGFISKMLNSVAIQNKGPESWNVTNKVSAYGFPVNVSFDLRFREVAASALAVNVVKFLRDEAAALPGTNRERFLILDMTNFSQLMYRNYSVIYIKELSAQETIIVAGVVAGIDINTADMLFNLPPFSTTRGTMMGNMKTQIMQMARNIQK